MTIETLNADPRNYIQNNITNLRYANLSYYSNTPQTQE